MSVVKYNRSITLTEEGYLHVTKTYASKNLSCAAVDMAKDLGRVWEWEWDRTSAVVLFELPQVFGVSFQDVYPLLVNYCEPYMRAMQLSDTTVFNMYQVNWNRAIKA